MSALDVIMSRKSVRRYKAKEIPKDIVERILQAGRQAPSAENKQPWHFIIVTNQEIKEKLSKGIWNTFVKDTAFTIVGCNYVGTAYARKWSKIDTTIALENMVIAAWSLGIGTCWVGDFKETEVRRLLKIPAKWKVISLITFGYPDEAPITTPRKPIDEIVSYDQF
jgi:nitroreductase